MEHIKQLVSLVKEKIAEIEVEKHKTYKNFNIFSILKMERKEVETHSAFIYELINPKGSHNQNDLFLKLFIEKVLELYDYGHIIKVTREDPTIENRRIDFVIETQKSLIGIEMKIEAGDQFEQLHSYKEELKIRQVNNQNIFLYYLTLFGDYASNESCKTLQPIHDYKIISFYNNIYEWLTLCIDKLDNSAPLKEAIIQYQNLIKIITNKGNKEMEDFLDNITNNIYDIKAMNIIAENYSLIWAKKEIEFWEKVENNLSKMIGDKYSITYLTEFFENEKLSYNKLNAVRTKSGKIRQAFGIYLEKDIQKTNYYLSISALYGLYNNKEIKINFNIYHNQSDNEKTNKNIRSLQDKISTTIVSQVNFYHYKDNDNLTYELFDEDFFTTITYELSKEIFSYLKLVEKIYEKIVKEI